MSYTGLCYHSTFDFQVTERKQLTRRCSVDLQRCDEAGSEQVYITHVYILSHMVMSGDLSPSRI